MAVAPPRRNDRRSTLTTRTVIGSAAPLPDLAYRRPAFTAGKPGSSVDAVIELEIAGLAAAVDVVAQRRAALRDRVGQRCAHFGHEARPSGPRQPIGGCG